MNKYLSVLIVAFMCSSCGNSAAPTNYNDCILQNIKNASTNVAAGLIRQACENKFKSKNRFDQFLSQKKEKTPQISLEKVLKEIESEK